MGKPMKSLIPILLSLFLGLSSLQAQDFQTISFRSRDGLMLSADLYMPHERTAPFILLFHQAKWSRGEYREIAPRLNELGFNCMAVDLRSGNALNGIRNNSYRNALEKGKKTRYRDAAPDILASIDRARRYYVKGKLLAWGSSYSATLLLQLMGSQPELVDAALAFSPGDYFPIRGEGIEQPVFITSAKNEKDNWWEIYQAIPAAGKAYFLPETDGNHGSRALWKQFSDSEAYWQAVKPFLKKFATP
jgi:dienelactone hydrolase